MHQGYSDGGLCQSGLCNGDCPWKNTDEPNGDRRSPRVDSTKLATSLFEALATCDDDAVRKLCARHCRISQNGGAAMDLETLLGFNAAVHKVVRDFRYENPVRSATATGFVEEHAVRGTLADGSRLDLQVCVVAEVSGGKVTAVREYVDNKAAEGLIRALSGS